MQYNVVLIIQYISTTSAVYYNFSNKHFKISNLTANCTPANFVSLSRCDPHGCFTIVLTIQGEPRTRARRVIQRMTRPIKGLVDAKNYFWVKKASGGEIIKL